MSRVAMKNLILPLLFVTGSLSGHHALALSPQKTGEIRSESRSFKTEAVEVIEYELGTLFVPENRSDPQEPVDRRGLCAIPGHEAANGGGHGTGTGTISMAAGHGPGTFLRMGTQLW